MPDRLVIVYGYRDEAVYVEGTRVLQGRDIEHHELLRALFGLHVGEVEVRHLNETGNSYVVDDLGQFPVSLADLPRDFFL